MIVKMQKVSLVVLTSQIQHSLNALRELGIVHLETVSDLNEKLSDLNTKKVLLSRAISFLPECKDNIEQDNRAGLDSALEIAEKIDVESQKHFTLTDDIHHLEREIDRLSSWGDFNRNDIDQLRERGIDIMLYEVTNEQMAQFPENLKTFVINKTKVTSKVAVVFTDGFEELPFDEINLPERPLSELNLELEKKKKELEVIDNGIKAFADKKDLINSGLQQLEELIEFETAVNSMKNQERISFITGFAPARLNNKIKQTASYNGWGVLIGEPADEDSVPTLIENPRWINAIKPVFGLLGTIPGYKEFDISMWFLLFFSIFWAMILGDAGYGLIFLAITLFTRIKFRKAPFEPFLLLFVTSITTIIWGGMSGNWFGVESFAAHSAVSWMLVPQIASFKSLAQGNVDKFIMHICFIIGAVHLSVAHILNFFRLFPSLKAYAEIGWLGVLWGLYLLIRALVLKFPSHPYALHILLGGLGAVIIFSEQEGNFIKGIAKGLSNLILISLGSIGFFSDIVSYVRLFAVGLATLEVAKSFNAMAAGLGSGVIAIFGSAFILFFGHGLNIILGCMSLIVHGVRLNMLEFSGHLSMEWSGFAYKPFKKIINKN